MRLRKEQGGSQSKVYLKEVMTGVSVSAVVVLEVIELYDNRRKKTSFSFFSLIEFLFVVHQKYKSTLETSSFLMLLRII